jgi:type I restriction enzyme, R subunit
MTSNFYFLEQDWPTLYKIGEFAEQTLYIDSNTTLIKLRALAENIAKLILKEEGLKFIESDNQIDRIRFLKRNNLLPTEIEQLFHSIRIIGNKANHQGHESFKDADIYLSMAVKISAWFKEVYGSDKNFDSSRIVYLTPQKYELAVGFDYNSLKKEHEKLIKEFNELKEKNRSSRNKKDTNIISFEAARKIILNENETRVIIDEQLRNSGWEADTDRLRYANGSRPEKGRNLAIAEWPTSGKKVDYALFLGLKFVGVVEAKKNSKDVISVLDESKLYSEKAQILNNECFAQGAPFGKYNVPFMFSANGREYNKVLIEKSGIWFLDGRKSTNRAKALKSWYSPKDLEAKLKLDIDQADNDLKIDNDYLESKDGLNLRYYQVEAIKAVEDAIIKGQDKILLTMATGTGKTRTAIALIYRLLKTNRFNRILFVVDRASLGNQAGDSFKEARMEDLKTFSNIYDVKELKDKTPEDATRVQIATVQGLVKRILYNSESCEKPSVGQYDCIIVDEAHRGYILDREMEEEEIEFKDQLDYLSKYRSVIEYFDAVKIGLTATPALHTVEVFGESVYEYSYKKAVIDGNLVDHDPPFIIQTKLNTNSMKWGPGEEIQLYHKNDGKISKHTLNDELDIEVDKYNKEVITESFNRTVLKELAGHLDPEGNEKTLIYAATDEHADMVVRILKEEFDEIGWELNDNTIQKITGYIKNQNDAIKKFKNETIPNIVVTVDLLTTGIDIPEIANLVFLRRVKSRILYEQMIGRATRLCDRIGKSVFRIYDAVGVYNSLKKYTDMTPVVQKPNREFKTIIKELSKMEDKRHQEKAREEIIAKIQRKKRIINDLDQDEFFKLRSGNKTPEEYIEEIKNLPIEKATQKLIDDLELFIFLDKLKNINGVQVISKHQDEHIDTIRGYGEGNKKPGDYLEEFQTYIKENINKIEALKILKTSPTKISRKHIRELRLILTEMNYTEAQLNSAWKESKNEEIMADIISFVKNAIDNEPVLDHKEKITLAVNKIRHKQKWTTLQLNWLDIIEKQLLNEYVMHREDFDTGAFKNKGGFKKIDKIFNNKLEEIVEEINNYLYIYA